MTQPDTIRLRMMQEMQEMREAAIKGGRESIGKMALVAAALKETNIEFITEDRNFRIAIKSTYEAKALDLMVNWQFLMPGMTPYPSYEAWLNLRGCEEEVQDDALGYDTPRKFSTAAEIVEEVKRLNSPDLLID